MNQNIISTLNNNQIVVMPSDTIYGIFAKALNQETVEKVYKLRQRNKAKPFIILISSLKDLEKFDIQIDKKTKELLNSVWPGPISVILSRPNPKFEYLHRGTNSLAFRIPDKKDLLEIIKQTGPLIAASANIEGQPPAKTISEARDYFGDKISLYADGGKIQSKASTIIKIANKEFEIIREGLGIEQIKKIHE